MTTNTERHWKNEVIDHCRSRGLKLETVERDGAVLVLHPDSESNLPDTSALRAIADTLDIEGVRYVTLGLDSAVENLEAPGDGDE